MIDSCLRLLGLGSDATLKQVKRAYKQRIRVCHPDRFQHDPVKAQEAEEKTKRLNAAYHFLLQHLSRTRFNRSAGSTNGFAAGDDRYRGSHSRGWPFSKALRIFRKPWVPNFRFGDPNLYRFDLGDYVFGLSLLALCLWPFVNAYAESESLLDFAMHVLQMVLVAVAILVIVVIGKALLRGLLALCEAAFTWCTRRA